MIYCISDIHGEYDRYIAMLEQINLSDDDTLYVLGDVIDRGDRGIDILFDIMERPNVKMLLGNHEYMCLATLGPNNEIGMRDVWQHNGGGVTYNDLMYTRPVKDRMKVLRYIESLPDHLDIEVNGRAFHLVHGYPGDNLHDRIWGRPDPYAGAPVDGATVIVGHTPTAYLAGDHGEPLRIWHRNGIIDIDCGCGNKTEKRRLACLRLDDMEEFYI